MLCWLVDCNRYISAFQSCSDTETLLFVTFCSLSITLEILLFFYMLSWIFSWFKRQFWSTVKSLQPIIKTLCVNLWTKILNPEIWSVTANVAKNNSNGSLKLYCCYLWSCILTTWIHVDGNTFQINSQYCLLKHLTFMKGNTLLLILSETYTRQLEKLSGLIKSGILHINKRQYSM